MAKISCCWAETTPHIYHIWPPVTWASTKTRVCLEWTPVWLWPWRLLHKRNIMNVILSGRNPQLICKYTQIFAIKLILQIYSHTFYTLLRFILLQQLLHIELYGTLIKNVISDITSLMYDFPT
jgi:hypothetical protein